MPCPGENRTLKIPGPYEIEDTALREYGDTAPHLFLGCDYWLGADQM